MENKIVTGFGFLVALLLVACHGQDKPWQKNVEEEVRTMMNDYLRAVREKGLLGELGYLDSTDQFSWHPPGFDGPIRYDSVAFILRTTAGRYASISSHWDTLVITPASETSAIYYGDLTSDMTDTSGLVLQFRLREEGMVIKRPDGWKLVKGKTVLREN